MANTETNITPSKKSKVDEIFKSRQYFFGIGRRKTATALARVYPDGKGRIYINGKEYRQYLPFFALQKVITRGLDLIKEKQNLDLSVKTSGGGKKGQCEAICLAIARALVKVSPEIQEKIKPSGLLKVDARIKERKKPGLKRARRAPQWAKR